MNSPSLKDRLITQAIAVVFFVALPILITLLIPLTNIQFEHAESGANVTVVRFLLLFLPWKTEQIRRATRIRADITSEKHYQGTAEERRKGQSGVRVATGRVAIISDSPEAIVQAAPNLAKEIVGQFDEFSVNKAAQPLTISVYASWSLSYILGGVATALCSLYIFGTTVVVLAYPFKWIWSKRVA